MKKRNVFPLLLLCSLGYLGFQGCTDLESEETDSSIINFAGGQTLDATNLLASAYKDLGVYADQANFFAMSEHTTDEMMGPTRGTDWGDNGIWRTLHAHTWDASHGFVLDAWNDLNSRAYKCNQILGAVPAPSAQQTAEAKFLRALYTFNLMDLYGQVPIRNVTDPLDVLPRVMTRAEAFASIIDDLEKALPDLPVVGPTAANTLASKAAARTLLARLYLNKAVYTGASDNADMDKVVGYCNDVATDGFTLEPNYFDNFQPGASKEIILTSLEGSGQNRIHMTLHYDHKPSGWNGFTTLSDFYNKFDAADQRIGKPAAKDGTPFSGLPYGFVKGQQFTDAGVAMINSRNGLPLIYTDDVTLAGAATDKGIRVLKYHPFGTDNNSPNYPKYIIFRYGDVVTMKAEAQMRKSDNVGALVTINALRLARGLATPLTTLDEKAMLDERGREMYWEGVRRTDLIRFGKFAETWQEKTVTEAHRVLFPIPQRALDSNPNLSQNAGY